MSNSIVGYRLAVYAGDGDRPFWQGGTVLHSREDCPALGGMAGYSGQHIRSVYAPQGKDWRRCKRCFGKGGAAQK